MLKRGDIAKGKLGVAPEAAKNGGSLEARLICT